MHTIRHIPQFTHFPASEEWRREEIFQIFQRHVGAEVNYLINGKNFTNNIYDANDTLPEWSEIREFEGKKYIVLPAGYDGVIVDATKNHTSIVLPTADCASISFYDPKEKKMGILHAGYKWTAAGIIDQLFEKHFLTYWQDEIENIYFDLSPMAGNDFELDASYYSSLFKDYLASWGLNAFSRKYFKKTENGKCHFSLRRIIYDLLIAMGASPENISISKIKTTDSRNDYYSFRLHSNYRAIQDFLSENFELTPPNVPLTPPKDNFNYYKKLAKNPNHQTNSRNGRMATIIENHEKNS